MSKVKLCKHCKNKLSSKDKICPQCGKKQGMGIVLKVIIGFFVIGIIGSALGETEEKETDNVNVSTETTGDQETTVIVTDFLTCPDLSSEPNTSSMVDEIASVAKGNASTMSDEQAAEIIEEIRKADHKFYNGADEMEKYMWYGYLLDYKYEDSDPRSKLGTDLCQAIKYVYRNAETVLDDATHENLLQIDKDLEEIE